MFLITLLNSAGYLIESWDNQTPEQVADFFGRNLDGLFEQPGDHVEVSRSA